MALMKNVGVDCVELCERRIVDVGNDSIEEIAKVLNSGRATIDIVKSGNAVEVINMGTYLVKNVGGFLSSDSWNWLSRITNFLDMREVTGESLE